MHILLYIMIAIAIVRIVMIGGSHLFDRLYKYDDQYGYWDDEANK